MDYRITYITSGGFLQPDDIGVQHDPHLRIIGGHRETLGEHIIHMLQNNAYCQGFFPQFFPVLAVANTASCVGPQNKIGHPVGCKFHEVVSTSLALG